MVNFFLVQHRNLCRMLFIIELRNPRSLKQVFTGCLFLMQILCARTRRVFANYVCWSWKCQCVSTVYSYVSICTFYRTTLCELGIVQSSLFAYTSYAENVPLHAFARRCCRNRSVSHALPGPAEGCKAAATGLLLRAMLERRDGRTSCRFIDIDHAPHTQLAVPETSRVWTTSCRRVYVTLGLCYNEIRVSPKTRVLFCGTLSLPNSGFRKFRPGN